MGSLGFSDKLLRLDNINPNIKAMQYAPRGPLEIRATELEKELLKVSNSFLHERHKFFFWLQITKYKFLINEFPKTLITLEIGSYKTIHGNYQSQYWRCPSNGPKTYYFYTTGGLYTI